MDPLTLASEIIQRLSEVPNPVRTQLLAWAGDQAVLRDGDGVRVVSAAEVPEGLDLSPLIDHTLLRADARRDEIEQLCDEARRHGFASVCVNALWVELCAQRLQGSPVRVCTVVGFPLGAALPQIKVQEAREAYRLGARDIDMVLAVGLVKSGDWRGVRQDLAAVRSAVPDACVKLILETCLLTDEEKRVACDLALDEGLDFVKTSTGFSKDGATESDVRLMRQAVGDRAGVKASGGIRTYADALCMVKAGATRLGLSSSLAVVQGDSAQTTTGY